ncbi:cytochrome P450 monooxygenase-like protein [Aulographum hederae CBS 113979]|uniref:Cytochrome P450 monooxygenase-like protein n=1 Tax=Aulographum hederae CBS 113979 TaxID=1176131 RepID=A0A6G1GWS5_9PEZI|nr:cytochrome P450 monooxygenase-like protein [Aulographum hederae CBS 113979]
MSSTSDTSETSATTTILLSAFSLYIAYSIAVVIYNIKFHPLSKFPGPSSRAGSFFTFYQHLFLGSEARDIKKLHDEYGEVVRIAPDSLSFNSANAWRDIAGVGQDKKQLRKDPRFYLADISYEQPGIMSANDEAHSRIRKSFSHAFSDAALREQEPILNNYFDLFIQRLKDQIDGPSAGKVDIVSWLNFCTFDIIGDLIFGEPFHALETGTYDAWISNIFQNVKFIALMRFGAHFKTVGKVFGTILGSIPAVQRAQSEHVNYTTVRVAKRLDTKTERKDFITYIMRHNDERGVSREEIYSTTGTVVIGGSETSATLLSGALYHLLQNPEIFSKLKDEVRSAFSSAGDFSLQSTGQLPYLRAVIEEALRIYPPVPTLLPRITAPEGNTISGYFVPGNTTVGVHQWSTYQSTRNFANPEKFVPERWLETHPAEYASDNKAACQPFSVGPRNCIGKNLAYSEMRSILARLVWHFEIELCAESADWMARQNVFILWEKPALMLKLSQRK